ncbi:hypothetical protein ACE10Z_35220 [Bradyrhizobium sp. Pha-3]|uniref:hypothetical protein n=1 Tax=Bradyrhizobium sp. Pha-3 TaxID=208375 RepID=UPI0035D4C187
MPTDHPRSRHSRCDPAALCRSSFGDMTRRGFVMDANVNLAAANYHLGSNNDCSIIRHPQPAQPRAAVRIGARVAVELVLSNCLGRRMCLHRLVRAAQATPQLAVRLQSEQTR